MASLTARRADDDPRRCGPPSLWSIPSAGGPWESCRPWTSPGRWPRPNPSAENPYRRSGNRPMPVYDRPSYRGDRTRIRGGSRLHDRATRKRSATKTHRRPTSRARGSDYMILAIFLGHRRGRSRRGRCRAREDRRRRARPGGCRGGDDRPFVARVRPRRRAVFRSRASPARCPTTRWSSRRRTRPRAPCFRPFRQAIS